MNRCDEHSCGWKIEKEEEIIEIFFSNSYLKEYILFYCG